MIGKFVRRLTFVLILSSSLIACGSQTAIVQTPLPGLLSATSPVSSLTAIYTPLSSRTATKTPPATPCLGFAPIIVSTPIVDLPLSWPFGELTTPSVPIKGMECADPQKIVGELVLQWLEKVKSNSPNQICGLEDYALGEIRINVNTITPQYDIVASVTYHVRPGRFGDCGWITARGEFEENGWIKTGDTFGVYREDGNFRLIVLPGWGT